MHSFKKIQSILLFLCVLSPVVYPDAQEEPDFYLFPDETPVASLTNWKTHAGDSIAWADSGYCDSAWKNCAGAGLWVSEGWPAAGVRWYRKCIFIPQQLDPLSTLAVYQAAVISANELFWDGKLIARNGRVGNSPVQEQPGRSGQLFLIPTMLTEPGKHVIALRVSNYHAFSGYLESPLKIGYFSQLYSSLFFSEAIFFFLCGVFCISAFFHLALLPGQKIKIPYLLFSGFCLSCAAYILIQSTLKYFQIDLRYYYALAAVNDIPWYFMIVLLPVFFMYEFSFPYKKVLSIVVAGTGLLIVLLPRMVTLGVVPVIWLNSFIQANEMYVYVTMFLFTVWGIYKKKAGGLTATAGLVGFLIGVAASYRFGLDYGWALGFALLIVLLTISLSRQMAQQVKEFNESQLRSARLELELLKKHIHPHFLLNSLNSIVAWLEEEPATAARLVNALADELRMLLDFAKEKTISLKEEIGLCEKHLDVMSLRHGKKYALQSENIDTVVRIPPLVLHTLIENGIKHGYTGKKEGVFLIKFSKEGKDGVITVFNDGTALPEGSVIKEGTGLSYVRSRLEEAFPKKWSLKYGPKDNGWEVVIKI